MKSYYPGELSAVQLPGSAVSLTFTRDVSGLAVTIRGAGSSNYATTVRSCQKSDQAQVLVRVTGSLVIRGCSGYL